ncbi:MAG: CBS domain-containing protein [Planctomycetota bacterium]
MQIKDVVNENVITTPPDSTVSRVVDLMLEEDVSSLVVVDQNDRPVGIVTESPLLVAVVDPQLSNDPISLHMQRNFVSIHPDEVLDQVVEKFLLYRVRHFPVVQDNKLLGIVTRRDLMRAILGQRTNS